MKKIITVILDGFGYREETHGNAILSAVPNNFNELMKKYPHTTLYASEEYVGLTKGQFGNSEVGHETIGAGRKIKQNETLINEFLANDIKENEEFLNMVSYIKETEKPVHIMGLFSNGSVHSSMYHFLTLYDRLVEVGIKNINFNLITDGRDTKINVAYDFIKVLEDNINAKLMKEDGIEEEEIKVPRSNTSSVKYEFANSLDLVPDKAKIVYLKDIMNTYSQDDTFQDNLNDSEFRVLLKAIKEYACNLQIAYHQSKKKQNIDEDMYENKIQGVKTN